MSIIECPFYPGKLCYCTCPNYADNNEDLITQSQVTGLTIETVSQSKRVNPQRFVVAKLNRILNPHKYLECDNTLLQ